MKVPALTPSCVLTDKVTDLVCPRNMLPCCGLAAVTSLKPVRMWRQPGSRYQVNCARCLCALCCLSACVCARMHAGITGFSWLSLNGILVADTPNLRYGEVFRMWPCYCIFAASLIQTLSAFYCGCQRSFNPGSLLIFNSLKSNRKQKHVPIFLSAAFSLMVTLPRNTQRTTII